MKTHEYQAKELFKGIGIPTQKSILCYTVEEALAAYQTLECPKVVVKAQVLTGGRGKAGGIKLASNKEEVETHARAILGMKIKDYTVDRILICEAADIASESYLSLIIDRNSKSVLMILSREGGMDIEEVAHKTPDKIIRIPIDSSIGIPDFLARRAAFVLFDNLLQVKQTADIIQKLYALFIQTDASLAEINPLVLTTSGNIVAVDAKMTFDNNAAYRQPEIQTLYELTDEEKKEQYAKGKGLSYVSLDGDIGCMVNGAGLAMATMDLIELYGGSPANFLDVGGSSNPNKIIDAMQILLDDSQVKVVLINIFGGITRCDDVAKGLIEAFKQLHTNIPVVVRLSGTNEKEGLALLKNTQFHVAKTMDEATEMAVNYKKLNQ